MISRIRMIPRASARLGRLERAMQRSSLSSGLLLTTAMSVLTVLAVGCSSSKPPTTKPSISIATSSAQASTTAVATGGLSGTWSGQYSGASQGTFTLTWQQSGSKLSGTIMLSDPAVTLDINGTLEGNDIRFGTVGSVGITYSGSVSGNSMSGTYESQTGNGPWSATKTS